MGKLQIKKIIKDMIENRGRNLLTMIAITLGVLGVGAIAFSYSLLIREMNFNYLRTNPMSASLYVSDLDETLVEKIASRQDIKTVERRGFYQGRIQTSEDRWKILWLFVIEDFDHLQLNYLYQEGYPWPGKGEILLERQALNLSEAHIGDSRWCVIPGYNPAELKITGTLYDPGEAPAWMENIVYGYITPETLKILGPAVLNELLFIVQDDKQDYDHIKLVTSKVKNELTGAGYQVTRTFMPPPGKHPHATQMASLLFLLQVFGLLVLFLGSILVINLISAMIAGQIRQIGIMKAIGARNSQIMTSYIIMVFFMGLMAAVIGIPLAVIAGRAYAANAARTLNFEIFNDSIPLIYFILTGMVGIGLPVLSSLPPIIGGTRITVREAFDGNRINKSNIGRGVMQKIVNAISRLSRPLGLAAGNTVRKKARLILTLFTLTLGGAVFISSFNIGAGITATINEFRKTTLYDISLFLKDRQSYKELEKIVDGIEDIDSYEFWEQATGIMEYGNGADSDGFPVLAPPLNSKLFKPVMEKGSYLTEGDRNNIVIRHMFIMKINPGLSVGDSIPLKINGKKINATIKGVTRFMGEPIVYMSPETLQSLTGISGKVRLINIKVKGGREGTIEKVMRELEKQCNRSGIAVEQNNNANEYRKVLEEHFLIIVIYLIILSVLIITVGGLGLATTMSIQVIEKTREIGIMRAIGASSHNLIKMIITEGFLIGFFSWLAAILFMLPLTRLIGDQFGIIFFGARLSFALDNSAVWLWLIISILISLVSSLLPAIKAVSLTVRETLVYE